MAGGSGRNGRMMDFILEAWVSTSIAVSYTHLDVYKRQILSRVKEAGQVPEMLAGVE